MKNTKKLARVTSALVLGSALLFGNLAYAKESVFVTKEDCDKHYSRLVKKMKAEPYLLRFTTAKDFSFIKEFETGGYVIEHMGGVYRKDYRILYACEKVYGNNENKK